MKKFKFKGYEIEVFDGYYGEDLYISKGGEVIYSARVHKGDAMDRVMSVVG